MLKKIVLFWVITLISLNPLLPFSVPPALAWDQDCDQLPEGCGPVIPVTNFAASLNGSTMVSLTWDHMGSSRIFIYERKDITLNSDWVQLGGTLTTSASDGPLSLGTYQYRILNCNFLNECSDWTYSEDIQIIEAPSTPWLTLPTGDVNANEVFNISYGSSPAITEYTVERNGTEVYVGPLSSLDHFLPAGDYDYRVKASNDVGVSDWSETKSLTINESKMVTIISPAANHSYDTNDGVQITVQDTGLSASDTIQYQLDDGSAVSKTDRTHDFGTLSSGNHNVKVWGEYPGTDGRTLTTPIVESDFSVKYKPVISAQSAISTNEDSSYTLTLADFTVTDQDSTSNDFTLTVSDGANYARVGNVITPNTDFNGTLTLPVTVSDGQASSDTYTATLTVNAVNDKPIVDRDTLPAIDEDTSLTILVSHLNISDVDDSSFTVSVQDGTNYSRTGNQVTPNAEFNGTLTVSLTVNDGEATSDVYHAQIVVNAVNDAPTIDQGDVLSLATDENIPISFDLSGSDIESATLTWSESSAPSHGNLEGFGTGNSRGFLYTPTVWYSGQDSFTIQLSDGELTDTITVNVDINHVNKAPVISEPGSVDITLDQNTPHTFTLNAIDPDNDTLSWSENVSPTDGTVTGYSTGTQTTLTYTPNNDFYGSDSFEVKVSDGALFDTIHVGVTVNQVIVEPDYAKGDNETVADAALVSPTVPANELIGAVQGKANVSGGAATYSIPVMVAPGRNGVQPSVSLNYSSRSGNGVAGVGWSVSYGSVISRCSSNMAQDGRPASIRFDASVDRLCLDGQKLKLVDGTYGANNATYATELESFLLITQQGGGLNSTSAWFKVEHRDGSVAYYGKTANSRHLLSGRLETLNWLLTKKHDSIHSGTDSSAKNVIHYEYLPHDAGEVLIDQIHYTGSGATLGNRRIKFVYESRNDTSTSYLFGGKKRQTKRLANIETYYASSLIRSYNLEYDYSRASERSILKSVEECGSGSQCLPLTNFAWQDAAITYELEELNFKDNGTLLTTPPFRGEVKVERVLPYRDINRDGARDWPGYFVNAEGEITNTSGTEEFQCNLEGWVNRHNCREADFNRDGRTDVWVQENGQVKVGYVNEDLTKTWITTNIPIIDPNNNTDFDAVRYIQDFNGDGWPDIAMYARRTSSREIILYMHTQNVNNPYPSTGQLIFTYDLEGFVEVNTPQFVGDFDGNGIPDIVVGQTRDTEKHSGAPIPYPVSVQLFDYDGSNLTFTTHELNLSDDQTNSEYFSHFIDVNGDGLLDWLGWRRDGGLPDVARNRISGELILRINEGDLTFSSVIDLGSDASLQALRYLTGLPGTPGDPPPFGPIDEHILPLYAGSFRSIDINGDGRNELLIPGNRQIDGCIEQLVGPGVQLVEVCGEDIYSTHIADPYNDVTTAPWPASLDESVYDYDAIYFDENSSGVITARRESSGLIGTGAQLTISDAFGDGLTDVVFTVGATSANSRLDRNGSSYNEVPHDGAYINRNKGSASNGSRYEAVDMMTSATNGLGHQSSWVYKPLSSDHETTTGLVVYDIDDYIDTDPSDPDGIYFHFASSMYVATRFSTDNGVGGENATEYAYRSAVYNADGRGFQGFRTIIVDTPTYLDASGNVDDYARAVSSFHQKFPAAGSIESVKTCLSSDNNNDLCENTQLSETQMVYHDKITDNGVSTIVVPINQTRIINALNDRSHWLSIVTNEIETSDIDQFGNVLKSTTTNQNGFSTVVTETVNQYLYNDGNRPWGKPDYNILKAWTVDGSIVHDSALDLTKEVKTEYTWTSYHQPNLITTRPLQGGGKVIVVDTDYNDYGLPTQLTTYEAGDEVNARTIKNTYSKDGVTESSDGYFIYTTTNDLDHVVTTHTAPEHGQLIKSIDANGLETETGYDIFGRVEQITPPSDTGQPAYQRFADCQGGCDGLSDSNIRYKMTTYAAGVPESVEYKDKFNRLLVVKTEGFDGTSSYTSYTYDALGRKTFESVPSFNVNEASGTEYLSFDKIGRLTEKTLDQPLNQEMTVLYSYLDHQTTIVATGGGRAVEMSRTYSGNNQLMQTIQKDGSHDIVTQYAYDATGNPIVVMDANNHPIKATYDALGHKQSVDDPNMGEKTFKYTAFGEVLEETDANGDTYRYEYDILGRVYERKLNGEIEASYYFDTAAKGNSSDACLGLPVGEDRGTGQNFSRHYIYDDQCRVTTATTIIDDISYAMLNHYDGHYGRLKGLTYPTGLTVSYIYNDRGYLTHAQNAASGYIYHQVTEMDARLQITEAQKADGLLNESREYYSASGQMRLVNTTATNGGEQRHRISYQYDGFGNLSRQDVENQRNLNTVLSHETYTYDDLHRLSTSDRSIDGTVQPTIHYDYDDVGNLTLKDDYATAYAYGDINKTHGNAGPNAVRAVTLSTGGTATFNYDENGNLINGNDKTIAYNAFNKPVSIVKGSIISTFYYGADQMRYKQVKTGKAHGTETTLYIGKAYEQITYNGETQKKVYIGDTIVTETEGANTQWKVGFVHRDRLDSVVTITDESGDVVDNKSYDPFGKPRKGTLEFGEPSTLAGIALLEGFMSAGDGIDLHTRRGFTDHEHLDDAELIHMNGRVYDYNIGRFLSVDPFIQDPVNSQSINPYSYVMNNPLAGVDPTGYVSVVKCYGRLDCDPERGSGSSIPTTEDDNGNDDAAKARVLINLIITELNRRGITVEFVDVDISQNMEKEAQEQKGQTGNTRFIIFSFNNNENQSKADFIKGCGKVYQCIDPQGSTGGPDPGIKQIRDIEIDPVPYQVPLEWIKPLNTIQELASQAAEYVDDNCDFQCEVPYLGPMRRGQKIHAKLTELVRELELDYFHAEISYKDGRESNWFVPGSIRADVVYGNIDHPEFVVEYKSGVTPPTPKQLANYVKHTPEGTKVFGMIENKPFERSD